MGINTNSLVFNGNKARVKVQNRSTHICGDGKISWGESHQKSLDLVDIRDPRLSGYLRDGQLSKNLGAGWKVPQPMDEALSPDCQQWLRVDPDESRVTIRTQTDALDVSHVLTAQFDAKTGKVNPTTIAEFFETFEHNC